LPLAPVTITRSIRMAVPPYFGYSMNSITAPSPVW